MPAGQSVTANLRNRLCRARSGTTSHKQLSEDPKVNNPEFSPFPLGKTGHTSQNSIHGSRQDKPITTNPRYYMTNDTLNKHKHLDFIQAAINRMAGNLFLLKTWSVTLVAALFALSAKDANKHYILIAYFPLFIFWALDGYFLCQERRFRALFDYVRTLKEENIDFSMNTEPYAASPGNTWKDALASNTLMTYYGGLTSIMICLMVVLR